MQYSFNHLSMPSRILQAYYSVRQLIYPAKKNKHVVFHDKVQHAEFDSHKEILDKSSLLSVSDLKGNILYVNDKFCEVAKYSREELIGQAHSIIRHPDTPASVFKDMWSTIGKGKVWQGEIKNKAKDGSFYWVYATISPVMGENGKPIKYISMRHDITEQKLLSEELVKAKQRTDNDLFDNVSYAKQIHNTFLTPEKVLLENFPESFLIYKAQKIVSGDFYLIEKKQDQSVIVLGDSTGHGVSASYISIMVLNLLSRILKLSSHCPVKILRKLHSEILYATGLNKENPIIESADMALCCIDHKKMMMEYALAKMRGIILRNGEIIVLERNKCSVGEHTCKEIDLTGHQIHLQKGDLLYLYTDGVIDQFGGMLGKKFGNERLMELIRKYSEYNMNEQKKHLSEAFLEWQGHLEQVDDMSLLGVKIN